MFRPICELCLFANFNGRFASWFQFANGKGFYEHAKYLAWLWVRGKGKGENALCMQTMVEAVNPTSGHASEALFVHIGV